MAEATHKSRDGRRTRCRLTGLGTVWCCATSFPSSPDHPYYTTQKKLPLSLPVHSISPDYSTNKNRNKNKKASEEAKRSSPTGEVIKQKSFMEKQQRMLSPGRVLLLVEPAAHDGHVEVEVELQNSHDVNPRESMIKGGATLQ